MVKKYYIQIETSIVIWLLHSQQHGTIINATGPARTSSEELEPGKRGILYIYNIKSFKSLHGGENQCNLY
jgi:hypothetical protein